MKGTLSYLFLIAFRAVYLFLWHAKKHEVISFHMKMFLVQRSHPFSIDGSNSNRGLMLAQHCSSDDFIAFNGSEESDVDDENLIEHSDDLDIDYIGDDDNLDEDDEDDEGGLEDVFSAGESAFRSSSPNDSTSLVGSTAREAVEAVVQQVLAQRMLVAERIKWVQDRLEVTATCLRPVPGPDEPLDLSTPPPRPSIEDLDAAHRAIYAILEMQQTLATFLESCEVLQYPAMHYPFIP